MCKKNNNFKVINKFIWYFGYLVELKVAESCHTV